MNRIALVGQEELSGLGTAVSSADPAFSVPPRSRVLCAGLACLSRSSHRALGGAPESSLERESSRIGAQLALLTKIDDQVIDALPFHGGANTPADEVRARVRAYLAPTLQSLRDGEPATGEGRCVFAADLGARALRLAASRERWERWYEVVAYGWEIQARAVALLTREPAHVDKEELQQITAAISGSWLLMVTLTGTLPSDVSRSLHAEECAAFYEAGRFIQQADALADLEKDLSDGHWSSVVGHAAWEVAPTRYLRAVREEFSSVYALVAEAGIDEVMLPEEALLEERLTALASMPEVRSLLGWIQRFLVGRYLAHPRRIVRERARLRLYETFSAEVREAV